MARPSFAGPFPAVDLDAERGTVLGLLGPNGAGKTTIVRVLTTLLKPDAGTATVDGLDVVHDASSLRERTGLAGQYAAVDENLTGLENLTMVGRLYGAPRAQAKARGQELLARFDLTEAGGRPVKTYSGGMRRRLDLAAALVAKPPVLFLDEPTTGLAPAAGLSLWGVIGPAEHPQAQRRDRRGRQPAERGWASGPALRVRRFREPH